MENQVKVGRPLGSIKLEYDRNDQIITLPTPGPGVFLIVSQGKVLDICASENIHRYARQILHNKDSVIQSAVKAGDVSFVVIARVDDKAELYHVLKRLSCDALAEKHISK